MLAPQAYSWKEDIVTQTVSRFEEVLARLRHGRPANTATARAIDRCNPWERFAMKVIDGGYFKSADEFVLFVDACLRHLSFEQITHDRAYAFGVRNLADAIAHRWACGGSRENAPTAGEIAGLLESEWMVSGRFRSLRSAIRLSGTENEGP